MQNGFWAFLLFSTLSALAPAFASDQDPLRLSQGADAEITANLPTEIEKAVATRMIEVTELLGDMKNPEKSKIGLEKLDSVLKDYPNYADGFLLKAYFIGLLPDGSKRLPEIIKNTDTAIAKYPSAVPKSAYGNTAMLYGLRAKIYKTMGV